LAYKMQEAFAAGIDRVGRAEARKIANSSHPLSTHYGELFRAEAHFLITTTYAHSILLENLTSEATKGLPTPVRPPAPGTASRPRPSPSKQPTAVLADEVASIANQRKRPNPASPHDQEPRKRPPPPTSGNRAPPSRPPSKQSRASPSSSSNDQTSQFV
jgi:hypothetical protein